MKNLLLAVSLFISFYANAQSFDGVPISGDLPTAVLKYKAKGYVVSKYIEQGVILKGKVAGTSIELFIFTTPKSKKVFKAVAYLDEDYSWTSLKSNYFRYYNIFVEKYGSPDSKYEDFITPYFEGDGYELSAVGQEKVIYAAYWFRKNNLTLGVEISKYKQVKFVYENNEMMEIRNKEQSQIESNSF
jgi:hypothetical protein